MINIFNMRNYLQIIILFSSLFLSGLIYAQPRTLPSGYQIPKGINYVRTWQLVKPVTDESLLTMSIDPTTAKVVTQYLDGLGRPLQTVIKKGSLSTDSEAPISADKAVDLVSTYIYDLEGRQSINYLPSPAQITTITPEIKTGAFKIDAYAQQQSFYNSYLSGQAGEVPGSNTNWAYGKVSYELSPISRPVETFAPGVSWVGSESTITPQNNRSKKIKYTINTANDAVRIWKVDNVTSGSFADYSTVATYSAGELQKTMTTDENGKQIVEYKNKSGLLVLKKVQLTAAVDEGSGSDHTGWICTYYIYDVLKKLRAIVQPEGVKYLAKSSINWSAVGVTQILNEQFFRYEYDHRGRMITKQVPGAGEVYMVYDKWDRLLLTQDARQRPNYEYQFTKYDAFDRPIMTGIYIFYGTIGEARDIAETFAPYRYEERTSSGGLDAGYTTRCWPHVSIELLSATYYDDYLWLNANGNPFSATRNTEFDGSFYTDGTVFPYPQMLEQSNAVKGYITGTKTRILSSTDFIYSINYYDEKGRIIQTQSKNITGGTDILTTQYAFAGQPLMTHYRQQKYNTNPQAHYTITYNEYDELGRLLNTKKTLSSNIDGLVINKPVTEVSKYEYDALGQLKKKVLAPYFNGGEGLETQNYAYNIRGWLLGINKNYLKNAENALYKNAFFGFELGYDKQGNETGTDFFHARQYNGNIAGMVWKTTGDEVRRKYDYQYDAANRLGTANYTQNKSKTSGGTFSNTEMDFSVFGTNAATNYFIPYDDNGNIREMVQRGYKIGSAVNDPIDNMRYTYWEGTNKLKNVVDFKNDADTKLGDFRTASTHPQYSAKTALTSGSLPSAFDDITDYDYDVNGNLISDRNKNISNIEYNHLNLPRNITIGGKGTITYTYDALGNKLKKTTFESAAVVNGVTTSITTITTYIGNAIYESKTYGHSSLSGENYIDRLQFFSHDDGRIRYVKATDNEYACPPLPDRFVYDYMLKDHLGNVRMVLTEASETTCYLPATVELATIEKEKQVFDITNSRSVDLSPGASVYTSLGDKYYRTHGNTSNEKTGLGIVLKVMSGDKVSIAAESYYEIPGGGTGPTYNLPLTDLLTALTGSGTISAAKGILTTSTISSLGNNNSLLSSFMASHAPPNTSFAKAHLNWILFDDQLKFVNADADIVNAGGGYKLHTKFTDGNEPVDVEKNGYLYIYVSNESNMNVFFDNLLITRTPGAIIEETHYYPFGLSMAGISSISLDNLPQNKNKFNDGTEFSNKEFEDGSGLEIYETANRSYDSQLGRFMQIDPLSNLAFDWSPYVFANNNPILMNDPSGLISDTTHPDFGNTPETAPVLGEVTVEAQVKKLSGGPFDGKYFGDIKDESRSYYGHSYNRKSYVFSNDQFMPYFEKLKKELDAYAKYYGWGSTLSGGSALGLLSVKDYKEMIKKLKKLKKSDIMKINGVWLAIGTILEWRSSQFSDMSDDLIQVLINYNNLHAKDPSGQKGIYKIHTSDFTGSMGGVGGHETESYYDISTKKYLGGTYFRL